MLRITAAPTTATTTTQAATTSKAKNCRGLIQKRAHTIDDFMEGNRDASACVKCVKSDHCFGTSEPRHCNLNLNAISPLTDSFKWKPQCGGLCMSQSVIRLGFWYTVLMNLYSNSNSKINNSYASYRSTAFICTFKLSFSPFLYISFRPHFNHYVPNFQMFSHLILMNELVVKKSFGLACLRLLCAHVHWKKKKHTHTAQSIQSDPLYIPSIFSIL